MINTKGLQSTHIVTKETYPLALARSLGGHGSENLNLEERERVSLSNISTV